MKRPVRSQIAALRLVNLPAPSVAVSNLFVRVAARMTALLGVFLLFAAGIYAQTVTTTVTSVSGGAKYCPGELVTVNFRVDTGTVAFSAGANIIYRAYLSNSAGTFPGGGTLLTGGTGSVSTQKGRTLQGLGAASPAATESFTVNLPNSLAQSTNYRIEVRPDALSLSGTTPSPTMDTERELFAPNTDKPNIAPAMILR